MEKFDVYDDNRLPTNKTYERGKKLSKNENRMVVHICIFNSKGDMLIQQRQSSKKFFPNMFDISCSGGAISGETSRESAKRELKEELGLDYDFSNERPVLTVNFENGFDDYYIVDFDADFSNLTLQKEEVQSVRWANLNEITKMIDDGEFIPYSKSLISLLFDYRSNIGKF